MDMKPGDFAAFAIQSSDAQGSLYAEQGLTKREYIATAILAGFCANATSSGLSDAPKFAVQMADWLLAALNPADTETKP
jgi:hypothetical protein